MIALLLSSGLAHAVAFGGSVLVGPVVTLPANVAETTTGPLGVAHDKTLTFHPTVGPIAELQVELGERFIHSLVGQFSTVPINADMGNVHASGRESIVLAGYRFTFDLFGRKGKPPISPYVGVGTLLGSAHVTASASNSTSTAISSGNTICLELDAVLGAHWRLSDHLGLRAEVTASTYGGIGSVEPKIGAYAMF